MDWRRPSRRPRGFTLLELMAATAISGLVALAVMTSARIGLRAWEKQQQAVMNLRRTVNVQDIVQFQLSNYVLRQFVAELPDRKQPMHFFFGEPERLVLLSSYSARERGRGGIVAADYFCERNADGAWDLYLDERPAPGVEGLADYVDGLESTPQGFQPVLRPFDRTHALLLWRGLRECGFLYWRAAPPPAGWVSEWSLMITPQMPAAISVQVRADRGQWKGLPPAPMFVRLAMAGVAR